MAKRKTFEITGDMVCPKCGSVKFSEIKNYNVSEGSKRKLGIFWFEYTCKKCNAKVIHYTDL